jgi:hypothetical protein
MTHLSTQITMLYLQKIKTSFSFLFLLITISCFSSCTSDSENSVVPFEDFIKAINKYDVSVIESYIGADKMPLFRQLYS